MNLVSQLLLSVCLIFFSFSKVNSWVSVEVSYALCQQNFTDVIHLNEFDGKFYTESFNIASIIQNNFNYSVDVFGCTNDCSWTYWIYLNNSSRDFDIKAHDYSCALSNYSAQVVWSAKKIYTGDTPNPDYLFSVALAIDYCKKGYNIDNNTDLTTYSWYVLPGQLSDCLSMYRQPDPDESESDFWATFVMGTIGVGPSISVQPPASQALITTTFYNFIYLNNHLNGILGAVNDTAQNLESSVILLSPYYYDESSFDFTIPISMVRVLDSIRTKFQDNLVKVRSILLSSVTQSPAYVDINGVNISRNLYQNNFYYRMPFDVIPPKQDDPPIKAFPYFMQYDFFEYFTFVSHPFNILLEDSNAVELLEGFSFYRPYPLPLRANELQGVPKNFTIPYVNNVTMPIIGASIASTVLNHYGFIKCDWVDYSICNTCCVGRSAPRVGLYTIYYWHCDQLIPYKAHKSCVFGGVNYKSNVLDTIFSMVDDNLDICNPNPRGGWLINHGNCGADPHIIRCDAWDDSCPEPECKDLGSGFWHGTCFYLD